MCVPAGRVLVQRGVVERRVDVQDAGVQGDLVHIIEGYRDACGQLVLSRVVVPDEAQGPVPRRAVGERADAARAVPRAVDTVPEGWRLQVQGARGYAEVDGCDCDPRERPDVEVHVREVGDQIGALPDLLLVVFVLGDPPARPLLGVGERVETGLRGDQRPDLTDRARGLPNVPRAILGEQGHVPDTALDRAVVALLRVVGLHAVREQPDRQGERTVAPYACAHVQGSLPVRAVVRVDRDHRAGVVGVARNARNVVYSLNVEVARLQTAAVLRDAAPGAAARLTKPPRSRHALDLRYDLRKLVRHLLRILFVIIRQHIV